MRRIPTIVCTVLALLAALATQGAARASAAVASPLLAAAWTVPAITSAVAGRLDLVAVRGSGTLAHAALTSGGWRVAQPLPPTRAVGGIAAASEASGQLNLFIRASDNTLATATATVGGSGATAWQPLGGVLTSAPAATSPGVGHLEVLVRGTNGAPYLRFRSDSGWNSWRELPGRILAGTDPALVAVGRGWSAAAVIGTNHRCYLGLLAPSLRFSGWRDVGGFCTAGLAAASTTTGQLVLFVRGGNGALYFERQAASGPASPWQSAGGWLRAAPAAYDSGAVTTVVVQGGNGLLYQMQGQPSGSRWLHGGWQPLLVGGQAGGTSAPSPSSSGSTSPGLYVSGNHLVNQSGSPVTVVGVNHSGSEYACVQGWGIFDGPVDNSAIQAMQSWHIQTVRLPLNEDCWLGINGVNPLYSGSNYRNAIIGYVDRLEAHGLSVVLDLHWSAPGSALATGQQLMPDENHAPAFWRSVAQTFKSDHSVLFELYNEPNGVSWACWRNGCTTPAGWQAAGMQQLVNVVRGTGATNVILLDGLAWANDLSGWLAYEPTDPDHSLVAAWHSYNFNACITTACWDATVAPVAQHVPVMTTEFGENDCAGSYVGPLMTWMDQHSISYLAWTWNTWNCGSGPALISNYNGTPTGFGLAVRQHFLAR